MARRLRKPLLPHQRYIVDVIGEISPETGLLAYSEVVIIGPRQATGKSELLLTAMTYRCTGFDAALSRWSNEMFGQHVPEPGPQRVLYAAQNTDEGRLKWRDVHLQRLLKSRYRKDFAPRLQTNREAMIWRNGSMWEPTSTTAKTAGTGRDTVDMPVIDEAWAQSDFRTELGLRPAMMTRQWRQMWIASMIPGLARAAPGSWPYLAKKREVGRARVDADVRYGTAFFDFSAADGADPGDPATWWSCMPGLGYTVTEQAVREDFEAFDLVDFEAEYLGWAPMAQTPRWTLIRRETWEGLRDRESTIVDQPAMAIEVDEDRSLAWIGTAGHRADGDWHWEIVEPGVRIAPDARGMDWVLPRALELNEDHKPCTWVIDPARPAASLIVPLRNRGIDVTTPNLREVAGACGRFYDATGEEVTEDDTGVRGHHLDQPELNRGMAGTRKLDLGNGAFVFVKKGTASSICPVYAVVLATHGVEVKGGEIYDVLDSVASVEGACPGCDAFPQYPDGPIEHYPDCPL